MSNSHNGRNDPKAWNHLTAHVEDLQRPEMIRGRVLLCENASNLDILRFVTDSPAQHIVQESNPFYQNEMRTSVAMLQAPETFLTYPLSTILTPETISCEQESALRHLEITFSKSIERAAALEALEIFLGSRLRRKRIISDIVLAADELFSNAVYNAPFTKSGPTSRDESIVLPDHKAGRISIGILEDRLVLLCEDMYGSLDIFKLLKKLRRCYEEGVGESINWGQGGAGIGTYMVFESTMALYYGIHRDQRTVVAGVYTIGKALSALNSKCLHYVLK